MSEEGLKLTLDENQEIEVCVSADPAVNYSGLLPTRLPFVTPWWVPTGVVTSGSVDIGGTIYVHSTPTSKWYSIYPQIGVEIDILEDRDVKFEPKQTRLMKGIVTERKRGQLITGFADELADERDID